MIGTRLLHSVIFSSIMNDSGGDLFVPTLFAFLVDGGDPSMLDSSIVLLLKVLRLHGESRCSYAPSLDVIEGVHFG